MEKSVEKTEHRKAPKKIFFQHSNREEGLHSFWGSTNMCLWRNTLGHYGWDDYGSRQVTLKNNSHIQCWAGVRTVSAQRDGSESVTSASHRPSDKGVDPAHFSNPLIAGKGLSLPIVTTRELSIKPNPLLMELADGSGSSP
ncbi:hypothetical protein CDAR_567611 [Caerostris darwini]|uniref:Uncharacterized protein n=1 Tax=Caerostris darwini TaxID=1538125 RepID=A0AAV4QWI4_9ARAC|nr:hypothetical protein CDAR_567611 [Caerostris darwini]